MNWVETLMVRHVEGLAALPASVPVPVLPRSALGTGRGGRWGLASPFDTYRLLAAGAQLSPDDTVTRWLANRLGHEYSAVTYAWFAERTGWPASQLWRAFEHEAHSLHARAACRAAAIAHAELSGDAAERIAADLLPRRLPPRRGPVWLGLPSAYTCDCQPPGHARGIARCEWNDIRGWRPRPAEYEEADRIG